jgi:ADP-ribosylglycohydrolase
MTPPVPQPATERQAELEDRAIGCFLGLAIGEAVGVEAQASAPAPGAAPAPRCPIGRRLNLALTLADSLLHQQALDPNHVMDRFLTVYLDAESDPLTTPHPGPTTTSALCSFYRTNQPRSGSSAPGTDTSGCIARLAPVVIFAGGNSLAARHEACVQALFTHGHDHCLLAADLFAQFLWRALRGFPATAVFQADGWPCPMPLSDIAGGSFKVEHAGHLRHFQPDVASTLEAALWAIHGASNFADAMARIVRLHRTSLDLPAVGAVAGQLAGALWGAKGIDRTFMPSTLGAAANRGRELLLASDHRTGFIHFEPSR